MKSFKINFFTAMILVMGLMTCCKKQPVQAPASNNTTTQSGQTTFRYEVVFAHPVTNAYVVYQDQYGYSYTDSTVTGTSWHKDYSVTYPFNKPGYANPIQSGFVFHVQVAGSNPYHQPFRDSCWINLYKNGSIVKSFGGYDICGGQTCGAGTQPQVIQMYNQP